MVFRNLTQTLCGASLLAVCSPSFMLRCHKSESLSIPFLTRAQRIDQIRSKYRRYRSVEPALSRIAIRIDLISGSGIREILK